MEAVLFAPWRPSLVAWTSSEVSGPETMELVSCTDACWRALEARAYAATPTELLPPPTRVTWSAVIDVEPLAGLSLNAPSPRPSGEVPRSTSASSTAIVPPVESSPFQEPRTRTRDSHAVVPAVEWRYPVPAVIVVSETEPLPYWTIPSVSAA